MRAHEKAHERNDGTHKKGILMYFCVRDGPEHEMQRHRKKTGTFFLFSMKHWTTVEGSCESKMTPPLHTALIIVLMVFYGPSSHRAANKLEGKWKVSLCLVAPPQAVVGQ